MYNTLLRYPGGKTRAVKILEQHLPDNVKTLSSIFFGGGSFELYLESKGVKVTAYDNFNCLINFWEMVSFFPYDLQELVEEDLKRGVSLETFTKYQKLLQEYENPNRIYDLEAARWFYVVNRCSFSGLTLSGGMSKDHPRFNQRSVDALTKYNYSNIDFHTADFTQSIKFSKNSDLVFMDPPYHIESNNLYGVRGDLHNDFNHEQLSECIKRDLKDTKFMLCYNDSKVIRELYKDYNIVKLEWSYSINNKTKSNEILITNY